jgi:cell division protein FtsB
MFLDYFALFLLFFVFLSLFYGIIVIHDIPYEIAKHRNHPQQDAIHVAGWISLFTLHVLWPCLWIWATLYREDRGWGFAENKESATDKAEVEALRNQLTDLQSRLDALEQSARSEKAAGGE